MLLERQAVILAGVLGKDSRWWLLAATWRPHLIEGHGLLVLLQLLPHHAFSYSNLNYFFLPGATQPSPYKVKKIGQVLGRFSWDKDGQIMPNFKF